MTSTELVKQRLISQWTCFIESSGVTTTFRRLSSPYNDDGVICRNDVRLSYDCSDCNPRNSTTIYKIFGKKKRIEDVDVRFWRNFNLIYSTFTIKTLYSYSRHKNMKCFVSTDSDFYHVSYSSRYFKFTWNDFYFILFITLSQQYYPLTKLLKRKQFFKFLKNYLFLNFRKLLAICRNH